ncbi:uncharacterized protein LOC113300261 isoform X1 [Papaver somniferum]|uniref:uncharacterized protein LOC113300261 isoform X1 n=1 Tax=Papaver somniferum TaxID=3469 RepID=UPI000E6F760A|nr:uncharacterized protein LOC113300261 isoform X1 [Papaver somniferum]
MVEGNEGRSWKKLNVFICLWFVQVLIYCKEHMSSVAHFLESRGMLKDALEVATDHLAIQLGSRCWKGAILSLSASSASSFCSLELLNFDRLPVVDDFDPRSLVAPSICHPLDFLSQGNISSISSFQHIRQIYYGPFSLLF